MAYKDKTKAKVYYAGWQRKYRKNNKKKISMQRKAKYKTLTAAEKERRRVKHNAWFALNSWKTKGHPAPTRDRPVICECCGRPPQKRRNILSLDHDHGTKRFRGWLCGKCNSGIAMLGDNMDGLLRAVAYMERA